MKKLGILILTTLLITLLAISSNQALAQNNESKSNGTFDIIAIHLPDSVVIKPAKGIKIDADAINVYIVSETNNIPAEKSVGVSGKVGFNFSGGYIFTDESIITIYFKVPADFTAEKIKFVVKEEEMYYNLAKFNWEE